MGLLDYDTTTEPEVVRMMRGFRTALLAGESSQQHEMAIRWLQVEGALRSDIDALSSELINAAKEGRAANEETISKNKRYLDLLRQLRTEVYGFADDASMSISAKQLEFGIQAIDNALALIRTQSIDLLFSRLPIEAVEAMVGLAGDGSPLGQLLRLSWADAADGMTRQMIKGVALGWSPRKTAEEMQKGMSSGLNRALNIARTEQLRVYRDISRQQYQESGVVTGYKRIAAKQPSTCIACLLLDGKRYELDEVMEEHPSGRCAMVPIVEGAPVVAWRSGKAWFEEQGEETQKAILGASKYDAWKDNQFDLSDMVAVRKSSKWGDSVGVKSLRTLTS